MNTIEGDRSTKKCGRQFKSFRKHTQLLTFIHVMTFSKQWVLTGFL